MASSARRDHVADRRLPKPKVAGSTPVVRFTVSHCLAIPRGLHQATRAQVLDLLTGAVAELRKTRDVHARTIAGERLDRGDECELLFVCWEGSRPEFFDEDGGER